MSATAIVRHDIEVADVEYLRHPGGEPLLARLFRPRGAGPFPVMVDLHGGAWCRGNRHDDTAINEALARSGVLVAALDFRMPPVAGYPASLADIHYGIRWIKGEAAKYSARADRIGLIGISSGGHQAALLGMRPADPRYAALPASGPAAAHDARVRCLVLCWPVIDPLGRYRYAKGLKAGGPPYPEVADRVLPDHDKYWQSEDAMAEGSPTIALERGEKATLLPVLYVQGKDDLAHPRPDLDRFVAGYRKAGGDLELDLIDGVGEAFIKKNPTSPQSVAAIERIVAWVHRQLD